MEEKSIRHDEGMIEEMASKYARKVDATLRTEFVRLVRNGKTAESVAVPNVLPASVDHIIVEAMKQYAEHMVARREEEWRKETNSGRRMYERGKKDMREEMLNPVLNCFMTEDDFTNEVRTYGAYETRQKIMRDVTRVIKNLPSLREGDNKKGDE